MAVQIFQGMGERDCRCQWSTNSAHGVVVTVAYLRHRRATRRLTTIAAMSAARSGVIPKIRIRSSDNHPFYAYASRDCSPTRPNSADGSVHHRATGAVLARAPNEGASRIEDDARSQTMTMAPCAHPTTERVTLRPMRGTPHQERRLLQARPLRVRVCRHTWVYPADVYHWLRPVLQQNLRRLAAGRGYTWDEPSHSPPRASRWGTDHGPELTP